jgi:predicted amidohydrolase
MTRVTCCQLAPRIGDLDWNRALTVSAIRGAAAAGADLVVLPELATSGYCFESREEAASVAVSPADPLFDEWAEAAADAAVVTGFCELGEDGTLYNSAAFVDRDGVRVVYRKTHLWDREKLLFEPGDQSPPIVETPFGRIGILICYDLEFPEVTRSIALRGADLIAVPTNWPLVDRPAGERPPEVLAAMASARTNRVFIACCDRTGDERGTAWTAGTVLINEQGWVVATESADFDLSRARAKALSPRNDALRDRRPELYWELVDGATARV